MSNQNNNAITKQTKRAKRKHRIANQLRGPAGNASIPPLVRGAGQVSPSMRMRDKVEKRVVRLDLELTSSAAGLMAMSLCTNLIIYNVGVGSSTIVSNVDIAFLSSFQEARIAKMELIWNPIVATSTAVSNFFICYDPLLPSANFASVSLGTILNYNNAVEVDPRRQACLAYNVRSNASSAGLAAVASGGFLPANLFAAAALSAYTAPGSIALQGSGLGVSTLLGRLVVSYLIYARGRI